MPALARHRVIRVDLPGSGRSQRVEGPLSIERYVETLLDGLHPARASTRAHWIGHSMGTIVCQHLAATHPKRVRQLALFGPLIAPPEAARAAMRRAQPRRARARPACTRSRQALLKARHLGRHAPAPAAGGRFRAREPDAPGRRGLCAQLRGARRARSRPRSSSIEAPGCWSPATRTASRRRRRCARWPTAACGAQQPRRRAAALRPLDAGRTPRRVPARAARIPGSATRRS